MLTDERFSWIIKDNITINKGTDLLQPGKSPFSLLGLPKYKGLMVALGRID